MKRYSLSGARTRMSDSADAHERNSRSEAGRRRQGRRALAEHPDPDVTKGQSTWEWTVAGLELTGQRSRE